MSVIKDKLDFFRLFFVSLILKAIWCKQFPNFVFEIYTQE